MGTWKEQQGFITVTDREACDLSWIQRKYKVHLKDAEKNFKKYNFTNTNSNCHIRFFIWKISIKCNRSINTYLLMFTI